MAHINADRVRDTSTTTGTGPFTVSGTAPIGFRTFSAALSTSDTFFGIIAHQTLDEWVTGLMTYSAANQITVTTVFESSNANAAVTFSAGTKDVFIGLPGRMADGGVQTLADGATITWNAVLGAVAKVTLGATGRTLTPSGMVPGKTYVLFVYQDGSGGRTITTWTNFKWAGGSAPALTTTASAWDIVTGVWDGTYFHANITKGFS